MQVALFYQLANVNKLDISGNGHGLNHWTCQKQKIIRLSQKNETKFLTVDNLKKYMPHQEIRKKIRK